MSKTLVYLGLLSLVAAVSTVTLVSLNQAKVENKAADGDEVVVTADVTAPSGALASARTSSLELLTERAGSLAASGAILRVVDPARAPRATVAVLSPLQPPTRASVSAPPDQAALDAAAQAVVDAAGSRLNSTVAVIDVKSKSAILKSELEGGLDAASLVESVDLAILAADRVGGTIAVGGAHYDIGSAPLNAGTHVLVVARNLDDAALAAQAELFAGADLSLVRDGRTSFTTSADALKTALDGVAAQLTDAASINEPPAALSDTKVGAATYKNGVVPLVGLDGEIGGALVLTVEAPTAIARGGGSAPAPTAPSVGDKLKSQGNLVGAAAVFGVLLLIGIILSRGEGGTGSKDLVEAIDAADSVDDLDGEAAVVARAVQNKLPDQEAGPKVKEKLSALEHEANGLRLEKESLESQAKQLEKQVEYARGEITRSREHAEKLQTQRGNLATRIRQLERALREARRSSPPVDSAASLPPAAQLDSGEHYKVALDSIENSHTVETPRLELSSQARSAAPRKEYDTAEVPDEKISRLLDDEYSTGDYGELEIPGEAYPSEEFPDLPGSLEALADKLTSMSDTQVRRLQRSITDTLADSPISTSTPAVSTTSQLWRVDPKETLQGGPDPAPSEKKNRATLPGGLRVPNIEGDESVPGDLLSSAEHATAPPPWRKDADGPKSLSPASLLEALKKRGQPAENNPTAERFTRGLLDKTPIRKEKPKLSQSGLFSRTGSRVDVDPTNDTEYFKSLYEDFLETKERCGESVDNITLERFVNRLARNKKQLVDRYNCRTVRFQVYVKEGRAALKATPVK